MERFSLNLTPGRSARCNEGCTRVFPNVNSAPPLLSVTGLSLPLAAPQAKVREIIGR
jgi:hypothetical protein